MKFHRVDSQYSLTQDESANILLNSLQNSHGYKSAQQTWSVSNGKNGLCNSDSYKEFARNSIQRSANKSQQPIVFKSAGGYSGSRRDYDSNRNQMTDRGTEHFDGQMSSLRNTGVSSKRLRSLSKNKKLASTLNYRDDALPIFEKYSEPLSQIYSLYAGMGEPLNSTKMKSLKFNSLLKDAGILDKVNSINCQPKSSFKELNSSRNKESILGTGRLSQVDADIIFTQLTGYSQCKQN